MNQPAADINIVIISKDARDIELLTETLYNTGLKIKRIKSAADVSAGGNYYRKGKSFVFFFDMENDGDDFSSFSTLSDLYRAIPVILLTKKESAAAAFSLMEKGASDFIIKGNYDALTLEKSIRFSIERKITAESLRFSNERYELVSKATNDMIWDWDLLNNKVFRSSEGWEKVFGPAENNNNESVYADSWWDRVHPEDKDVSNTILEKVLKDRDIQYFEIECRIMRNDNSYATVVDRGYVVRNEAGEVIRLIGATHDITEKKAAEEELKKLSIIAEETINAVVITNTEGSIQWVNRSFETITGYTQDQITGIELPDFFRSAGTDELSVRFIRRKLKAGKSFDCNISIYKKNNSKRWLLLQCQAQQHSEKLTGFFAIITDITSEKEAEEMLTASEKKFRSIIEKSSEGIALVNRQGELMEMSGAGRKILGYDSAQHYPEGINFTFPEDLPAVTAAFNDVIKNPGNVKSVEYRFQKASGEYTWLESAFHNLLHEPEIEAVVIHFRDISSRKYFEDVLTQSEGKYRHLFNNNPASIIIWDINDLSVIEVNDAAIREYGYKRKDFLKLTLNDLTNRKEKNILKGIVDDMLKGIISSGEIWHHITATGKEKIMDITFQPIDYYGKKASLAIVNNITEKTELEEKLAAERRIRQDEITYAVITAQEQEREELGKELHDNINQILATTKLYIEYSLTNEDMRPELLKSAKGFIESAVAELRSLSKSLLPPSLGEVGLIMALNELVESLLPVNSFKIVTEWNGIDEKKIPEQLKLTIFRIIQEQLNNISKHANADKVWLSLKTEKKKLSVEIKDNGRGFDLQQNMNGVGLKNIFSRAQLHNGKVDIITGKGKGCTLSILFKL